MAVEIASTRNDLMEWLQPLNDWTSAQAVVAERTLSKALGGSCQVPLAAYATIDDGRMRLRAMVATPDGARVASAEALGPADAPAALGLRIAQALRAQDAAAILADCLAEAAADTAEGYDRRAAGHAPDADDGVRDNDV